MDPPTRPQPLRSRVCTTYRHPTVSQTHLHLHRTPHTHPKPHPHPRTPQAHSLRPTACTSLDTGFHLHTVLAWMSTYTSCPISSSHTGHSAILCCSRMTASILGDAMG